MESYAVVARLSIVSLGYLVSMGGTVYTISDPFLRPSPPIFLEELACSRRTLTSPTIFLLMAVRTASMLVIFALQAKSCSITAF